MDYRFNLSNRVSACFAHFISEDHLEVLYGLMICLECSHMTSTNHFGEDGLGKVWGGVGRVEGCSGGFEGGDKMACN